MSSYVEIANAAATTVGTAARLTAPGDDTVLGRAVASVWDIERLAALRDGAWNFAMRRANLPALAEAPKHGFTTRFQLPADCLRLIEIYDLHRDHWQLEGRAINADMSGPLRIRYLADIEEPAEFDPTFAKAFSLRLASAIGNRIAGSAFKEELTLEKYRKALADARMVDAIENPSIEQAESSWIEARWYGSAADNPSYDYGFGPSGY
ncbi:MAG: hypothetical protein AAGE86_05775 [Pseudomonadota bacterium]